MTLVENNLIQYFVQIVVFWMYYLQTVKIEKNQLQTRVKVVDLHFEDYEVNSVDKVRRTSF